MAENLGRNDPYRDMERSDIRPGFLADHDKKKERDERRNGAAGDLKGAEENAAGGADNEEKGGGLSSVANRENNGGGLFTGVGKGKGGKGKGKGKGFLKRKGPMGLILGLIGGFGGLMMGSQSLMPMAIEEMIIEKFNSIGISSTMASDSWLDTQLNYGVRLGNINAGDTANLFAFSDYQVKSFESQGLKVVQTVGGSTTQITAILYKSGGTWIPVVGSDILKYNGYTEADLINAIKEASGLENIGSPVSAATALADGNFKTPYTTASKSWRGGASGWFDKIMTDITETKLSINRNRWSKWIRGSIKDLNKSFKEIASKSKGLSGAKDDGVERKEDIYKKVDGDESSGGTYKEVNGEKYELEGVEEIESVEIDKNGATPEQLEEINARNGSDGSVSTKDTSVGGSNTTIESVSKVLNSKAVKAAAGISEYGCAVLEGLMSVYTVVSAYQSLQFLNLVSGFLESVDKVKAGDGNNSPINEYSNNMTTAGVTTDDNNNVVSDNKSAMQSAGIAWLFGGSSMSQNDPSVRNINFETVMSGANILFDNIKTTAEVYEKCGYVKAAVAAVNLVSTAISFIPLFGQGFKVAQIAWKEVGKAAIKVAVQIALYAIIPIAAKNLTKMLIKNAATEWFGEDLGNALVSGANKYLGGNGTSGGQSPGSKEKTLSYIGERNIVIAEEAEYQRSVRSPFDVTSPYTFLGSLVYASIPFAYSNSGIVSTLVKASNTLSSAMVKILPTAMAISEQDELASIGDCPLLESTGAIGDAFCNPYVITDVSTIKESPVAISDIVHRIGGSSEIASNGNYKNVINGNFDGDGTIKADSDLAKYIIYCGQRTSQYGIKDAAIAERITGSGSTGSKIIGYIPVLNDLQSISNGLTEEYNLSWTNGSACVASDENEKWNSDFRYYQRYAENERLLENINPGYESPVTKLALEYYEANPVDDSLEGQLARFSGMSKEEVEDTLALIEYYQYIAEYDASERYAFGAPVVEEPAEEFNLESENLMAGAYILVNDIMYADVRNRVNLV